MYMIIFSRTFAYEYLAYDRFLYELLLTIFCRTIFCLIPSFASEHLPTSFWNTNIWHTDIYPVTEFLFIPPPRDGLQQLRVPYYAEYPFLSRIHDHQ